LDYEIFLKKKQTNPLMQSSLLALGDAIIETKTGSDAFFFLE
jgi:hypothetical protein